ncbi:MAG: hypothetical protein AB1489_22615 [Acidobacteriota bacterium]
MCRRACILIFLIFLTGVLCWAVRAAESIQLDRLDDIGILRFVFPNQPLTTGESKSEPNTARRYQVGEATDHLTSVNSRIIGKFTQPDEPELLAIVGEEAGSTETATTGLHALLIKLDKNNSPLLVARSVILQRKLPPFGNKIWRPAVVTDIDFDKQDDVIMVEGDANTGVERYSIYRWGGKDFVAITDHPALTLLNFYAHLDAAARAGQSEAEAKLTEAFGQLSAKMQDQQTVDSLRRRLQNAKGVELENFKVMIKSETSALIRLQYRLLGETSTTAQQFQGDYQIRRGGARWQLDSERLKAVNGSATK